MMKKIYLLMIGMVFLLSMTSVSALERFENLSQGDDGQTGALDASWSGQTFTVGTQGTNTDFLITTVSLKLHAVGSPTTMSVMIVELNSSGAPNGAIISQNISFSPTLATSPGEWFNLSMSSATLNASSSYGLVFNATGTLTNMRSNEATGTSYTGGTFCTSTDRGANWGPNCRTGGDTGRDFLFEIWGTEFDVTLNTGDQQNLIVPSLEFNATLSSVVTKNFTNATLFMWRSNSTLFNNSVSNSVTGNTTNTTLLNFSSFEVGAFIWNVFGCLDDNTCQFAENNRTFNYGITDIKQNHSAPVYETDLGIFNVTFNVSAGAIPSGFLNWNGTRTAGTATDLGSNMWRLVESFDFPLGIGVKNVFWELTVTSGSDTFNTNTTKLTQVLNATNFTICGAAPQDVPFINFTYRNETVAQEFVTAFIPSSSWEYWLGSGTVKKPLTFSNSTEVLSHAFCLSPSTKTLSTNYTINYNNDESQQRRFVRAATQSLTSVVTSQVLYLLPTNLAIFQQFNVVGVSSDPLAGVLGTMTRSLGGSIITVASDSSDSSGFLGIWLNPDVAYGATFSRSGLPDNVFTITPSNQIRTVVMGVQQAVANGTQLTNTTYTILPANSSLVNNTLYTFEFNVTSSRTITLMSMNITNTTGEQVLFQSQASAGSISGTFNTANNTRLIGRYVISTAQETISFTKVWTVGNEWVGDYSLFRQFNLFDEYEFSDFIRILLVMAFITAVMILLSREQLIDTSESKVAVLVLLVWAFSLVGWLDTGLTVSSDESVINTLGQFSSQYGIAILTTAAGTFFWFRRIFIRRI